MIDKKKITLFNRYYYMVYLEWVDTNLWEYKDEIPEDEKYMQITMDKDDSIMSIDPPGGPMIMIGDIIENETIVNIWLENNRWMIKTTNREEREEKI